MAAFSVSGSVSVVDTRPRQHLEGAALSGILNLSPRHCGPAAAELKLDLVPSDSDREMHLRFGDDGRNPFPLLHFYRMTNSSFRSSSSSQETSKRGGIRTSGVSRLGPVDELDPELVYQTAEARHEVFREQFQERLLLGPRFTRFVIMR